MTLLNRLVSVWRWIAKRKRVEEDLDDELRTFVDMASADRRRDGATPAEARRLAVLQLGGAAQVKERVRAHRHGGWLDEVGRDVGYGLRQVRRNPGFSAVAITTLALGIGVNTAVFSAVDAVLLKPLPFADADRLVMVWLGNTRIDDPPKFFVTPPEWAAWRRLNAVFTDIAASQPADAVLSGDGMPEDLVGRKVTGNFWTVLGVQPQLGRVFTEAEDTLGARVVVISHAFWQRRFGGVQDDVIGRNVTLNDQTYEVIGVLPRSFYFMPTRDTDVWMPASFTPGLLANWGWHDLHCIARLKPDVSVAQAQDAMAALSLRVSAERPSPRPAVVTPLREELAGKTSMSLVVLFAAAGAVLLIACVNVTNLLLARGSARHHEVLLRAALGASRGRLVRQLLVESLVLAGLGAVAGVALAIPAMQLLETLVPPTMGAVELTLDWRALGVSAAMAVAAAVTFGVVPAVRGSRTTLHQQVLRAAGRGNTGAHGRRFQQALIVAQTAIAMTLLATGGLLLQTLQQLRQTDLGIRQERLLTFVTPLFRYADFDQRVAFVNSQLDRIRAVPGVERAAAISRIPLTVTDQSTFYRLEGQTGVQSRQQLALARVVTRDYFETVGATVREGRFFDETDVRSDAPSAIVNETFVGRHFANRSPIGARLQFGNRGQAGYWYTIVGVAKDIRERGVIEDVHPAIYRVLEQADQATAYAPGGIVVRSSVAPETIVAAVRTAILSLDSNQPMARVQTMGDIVTTQLAVPSQNTWLLGALALLALVLASVGLYGVLSYSVVQRTREIGTRMALGARPRDILLSVGGQGLMLTLAGLAIGLVLSALAMRALRTLYYGVSPSYPSAAVVAALVLMAVAAVACLMPAWRASRVSPVIALR